MEEIYFRSDRTMLQDAFNVCTSLDWTVKGYIGRIITGEAFVQHGERERLIEAFQPMAVDMESASVAHVCYANSIPYIVVRAISDRADEEGTETFEANVEQVSINALRVVEELLRLYGKR